MALRLAYLMLARVLTWLALLASNTVLRLPLNSSYCPHSSHKTGFVEFSIAAVISCVAAMSPSAFARSASATGVE